MTSMIDISNRRIGQRRSLLTNATNLCGQRLTLLVVLAIFGGLPPDTLAEADTGPRVETSEGTLLGLNREASRVFLGIRYAAAPTGEHRWQPPQGITPWSGVRQARALAVRSIVDPVG